MIYRYGPEGPPKNRNITDKIWAVYDEAKTFKQTESSKRLVECLEKACHLGEMWLYEETAR